MSDKPSGEPHAEADAMLAVDQGFRRWYASCPCCLGDSYPAVKAAIEAEQHDEPHA